MIAEELGKISRHPYVTSLTQTVEAGPKSSQSGAESESEEALPTLFQLLRTPTGVNFTDYKRTGI